MSGVWVFKNGVVRLVENPATESLDGSRQGSNTRRKVLVHTPSNEVITSYAVLESKLWSLGWERYYDDPNLLQFHKRSTVHLISLPKDFSKFKSIHMYDIVVKNRNVFEVRDM
ncbi:ARABIDOPSIS FLOWERING PROMOTING FACTOR 1, FLOWERING PROMOTING FACTOR 1 [Hibiscus trionum]|uniref:ARABIDOPSIS FLOWERING PROMOTING FACTOR 1, FLOWERING PROMOTING FACTOR 1 n=1 Tax=Hibiscus trionum TaxID=183268 RepID=A0A9W7HLN7_HIBTR|nr:ARABIDOPSIS FLOWERING PROMOTING FACTOR 1, FLOWERING PROMOTING FACTOR 1 [Hibiscus trionum]